MLRLNIVDKIFENFYTKTLWVAVYILNQAGLFVVDYGEGSAAVCLGGCSAITTSILRKNMIKSSK